MSLWLLVVVIGLSATAVCIVTYRTGSRDDVPWHDLGIVVGLPSALCASFACLLHAREDFSDREG